MLRSLFRSFTELIGQQVLPATFTDFSNEARPTHGKSWASGLLRLKSNEDLHKLWYVLLKEKNLILSDRQLLRQQRMPLNFKQNLLKVRQSMARILTIVREREIEKEKYWQSLLDEYLAQHEPLPEPPVKAKKVFEDTEEWKNKKEKRKKAILCIKSWKKMNNKERKSAIQKEYAKQAKIAKEEFIKELKYVGLKLREKGIKVN